VGFGQSRGLATCGNLPIAGEDMLHPDAEQVPQEGAPTGDSSSRPPSDSIKFSSFAPAASEVSHSFDVSAKMLPPASSSSAGALLGDADDVGNRAPLTRMPD